MWITGKLDLTSQKDALFNDLVQECKHASPGARLSYPLRNKLERFSREERKEIICRVKDGCAPLFMASKRGHVDIVEYLLTVCNADIEQRGIYEVPDDRSVHYVTSLWCAAVSGRQSVVRCLVENGANVNSVSDSGSTPVRSACFMSHLEIVTYLVENNADILKPNYNGGTCLINSVQSVPLCLYLLQHGALVNAQDIQNKTALHYAIQEHRFETTKLLLEHGADPFLKSRYNDDALQTACLKGATQIFDYLIEHVSYNADRVADAYELIGTTFLDEHNDTQLALYYWKIAVELRNRDPENLIRKNVLPPNPAYQHMVEYQTDEDLQNVSLDLDVMRIQSLLICERLLGKFHKDMLFRLMYRGAAYADALQYQRCIDLWCYALQIRVEKDSILFSDTCFTAQALVRLYLDLYEKHLDQVFNEELKCKDVMATIMLLTQQLIESRELLEIKPVYKRQQDSFDRILKCLTHLIYLLLETCKTPQHQEEIKQVVNHIVQCNPRTSTGDTLLHLAVSKLNTIKSSYFVEENQVIFPNYRVTSLLLECGAPVNARNDNHSTALHVAAHPTNFICDIVKLLLDNDAHLDQQNKNSEHALTFLAINPMSDIPLLKYMSLRCLAATVVCRHNIPYIGQIPATLETFVRIHHE